jgi:hypothetical protein
VRAPDRAAVNRQGRQVTTAAPAGLGFRAKGFARKAVRTPCPRIAIAVWGNRIRHSRPLGHLPAASAGLHRAVGR